MEKYTGTFRSAKYYNYFGNDRTTMIKAKKSNYFSPERFSQNASASVSIFSSRS